MRNAMTLINYSQLGYSAVMHIQIPRRQNFQTVSWFWDIHQRKLLDLDPPYQRRSVWTLSFKEYFIDTILLNYPAPAIFLYEDIGPEGRSKYNVVDGKQRLTTIFEFITGQFPISEVSQLNELRGRYFKDLSDSEKKEFWSYQFLVEYLPVNEESIINNIFDRINRNVAKLTPQELRHARYDGQFMTVCDDLTIWMLEQLPQNFPRFSVQSKKQMKDVEFVALLLLLIEEGPKSYSQADLDEAFAGRDESWEAKNSVEDLFRLTIQMIKSVVTVDLQDTRLRNQADFYSLFGALVEINKIGGALEVQVMTEALKRFLAKLDDEGAREADAELSEYWLAARSNSNDKGQREVRIKIVKKVLLGE